MGTLISQAARRAALFIAEKSAKHGVNMTDFLGTTSVDDVIQMAITIGKEIIKP